MKNQSIRTVLFGLLVLSALQASSLYATVDLKFIEAMKFSDVDLSGMGRKQSIRHVKSDFAKLFKELSAGYIAAGGKLNVKVTEIDLPGEIDYFTFSNRPTRIVRQHDFYRLYFDFKLEDSNGRLLKQGREKIKDFVDDRMSTRVRSSKAVSNVEQFRKNLEKWFESEIAIQ